MIICQARVHDVRANFIVRVHQVGFCDSDNLDEHGNRVLWTCRECLPWLCGKVKTWMDDHPDCRTCSKCSKSIALLHDILDVEGSPE